MDVRKILLIVILATVLATFANSSECPSKENLQNCECEEKTTGGFAVHCYGDRDGGLRDITECKTMLQNKFSQKTELDLYFENFQTQANLTSNVFDGLRVRKLTFVHCRIDKWADEVGGPAFVGLEDSLEEIEVQDSFHQREKYESWRDLVTPFTLSHIRWLRTVKFHHNRLYGFGDEWFKGEGKTIEELDLQDNELHSLGSRAFSGLTNLRVLNLADNEIEYFPSLYRNKKIVKLNVRNNKLNRFVRNFFSENPNLRELDISGNPFIYLTEETFGKIWSKLDSLDVSDTLLHCDDSINWMIHALEHMNMRGTCALPADVAGKQLRKVIAERRRSRK